MLLDRMIAVNGLISTNLEVVDSNVNWFTRSKTPPLQHRFWYHDYHLFENAQNHNTGMVRKSSKVDSFEVMVYIYHRIFSQASSTLPL